MSLILFDIAWSDKQELNIVRAALHVDKYTFANT